MNAKNDCDEKEEGEEDGDDGDDGDDDNDNNPGVILNSKVRRKSQTFLI